MSSVEEIAEAGNGLTESVDMLLKAIADDDRNAFSAAAVTLRIRREYFENTLGELMGATA